MTWQDFIIDGHNRWQIIQTHDLEWFEINRDADFETEDDVLEWIFTNQLGRRNLTANQRTLFIGELYALRKKKVGEHTGNQHTEKWNGATIAPFQHNILPTEESFDLTYEIEPQFIPRQNKTASVIAKEQGVSPRTVHNAAKIAQAVKDNPELKQDFLSGKVSQKEILSPALKQTLQKKQEIKTDASARWREATYKIYLQLTSISDNGGIEQLTQKWDSERLSYWRDELKQLQTKLGNIAEEIQRIMDER